MKVIVVYDDTGRKSEVIADIIGGNGFADVVVKKRRLEEYMKESLEKVYGEVSWNRVHSFFEYAELLKKLEYFSADSAKVIHCFSNYIVADEEKASLSFKKLEYIDEPYGAIETGKSVAAFFPDVKSYLGFLKNVSSGNKAWDLARNIPETFEIEGLVDIGSTQNFIQCVTGNFDSRYFNSLKGNEYTVVKTSDKKEKIKAEYEFYKLLPEDMKHWFVMPFDYKEDEKTASYSMERLHMTDLSIKWVHGSMGEDEFSKLCDKFFYFFKCRHARACEPKEYEDKANALYVDKVLERIEALKAHPAYEKIDALTKVSEDLKPEALLDQYFELKKKIESKVRFKAELVIGHGDPCFANTLYNKSTQTLKFIDPKGALTEEEMWTNPYYDVAKLSHSVCGGYDFFNNGLFDIKVSEDFSLELEIPFDNLKYKEIFKKKLEENGFDYDTVRIYEVSLFLSMLPLHMDNPHKVLGFMLNAKNILKELKKDV